MEHRIVARSGLDPQACAIINHATQYPAARIISSYLIQVKLTAAQPWYTSVAVKSSPPVCALHSVIEVNFAVAKCTEISCVCRKQRTRIGYDGGVDIINMNMQHEMFYLNVECHITLQWI